jgi:hypothetical protein
VALPGGLSGPPGNVDGFLCTNPPRRTSPPHRKSARSVKKPVRPGFHVSPKSLRTPHPGFHAPHTDARAPLTPAHVPVTPARPPRPGLPLAHTSFHGVHTGCHGPVTPDHGPLTPLRLPHTPERRTKTRAHRPKTRERRLKTRRHQPTSRRREAKSGRRVANRFRPETTGSGHSVPVLRRKAKDRLRAVTSLLHGIKQPGGPPRIAVETPQSIARNPTGSRNVGASQPLRRHKPDERATFRTDHVPIRLRDNRTAGWPTTMMNDARWGDRFLRG